MNESRGYWRKPTVDERLQRLIEKRIDRLEAIAHIMEGDHSVSFPPPKNHLDRWEMAEVERVNRWRTSETRLSAPTPSMYEASRLQRYIPKDNPVSVDELLGTESAAADG